MGWVFAVSASASCNYVKGPANGIFCTPGGYSISFEWVDFGVILQSLNLAEFNPGKGYLDASRSFAVLAMIISGVAIILQIIRICIGFPCGKHIASILMAVSFVFSCLIFLYFGVYPKGSNLQWGDGATFTIIAVLCFLGATIAAILELRRKKHTRLQGGGPMGDEDSDDKNVAVVV